ncbi:E3 ubiquitin-protein ligase NRDP1-like [Antedon mediterranea]|uniref:E3 ubiquitin-protein ligase NRDP1-like n=1 Tax=Antedon mediterranea TaxID=105859 RepID=UPI003AF90CAF
MGYDVDRFVSSVNDGLLCCICRDVLEDPLQSPCEHAYCRSCIQGWLVHEQVCPEDRQSLLESQLKPLFRYMRNDLNNLRIRCLNRDNGCEFTTELENLARHESACEFGTLNCPNKNCPVVMERRELDIHLVSCEYTTKQCPKGCGLTILSSDHDSHNCVGELRTELELLRSEMICKLEDQRHESKLRLDSQRTHMVQKISGMQQNVDELRGQLSNLQHEVRLLNAMERKRRQDMERMELEKKELIELLQAIRLENETAKSTCRQCKRNERITSI